MHANLNKPKFRDKLLKFVKVDDFCKEFQSEIPRYTFHIGHFTNLKHFYLQHICLYYQDYFPGLVSYNRFVELQQRVASFLPPITR